MCFIALVCVIPEDIYRRGHVSVLLRFAGRARSRSFGKSGQPTETSAKYVQVLLISSFFLIMKNKLSSEIHKQNTIQDVIGFLIMTSMSGTNALRITKAKCYPIIKKHFLSIQANIYFFLHPRHVCVPFPD